MAKITVAKLLKTKNRLTSEISRVKSKIKSHNTYIVSKDGCTQPEVEILSLVNDFDSLTNKLIEVKSAINTINVKSASKIYRLSEVKGQIAFWESVDCSSAKEMDFYGSHHAQTENQIKKVQISVAERDQKVKSLIKQAEKLQDELDEFNTINKIELADDVLL